MVQFRKGISDLNVSLPITVYLLKEKTQNDFLKIFKPNETGMSYFLSF